MKKAKGVVQFNKTVSSVVRTKEQEEARLRIEQLKIPRKPLGGAPPVKIPPLDSTHIPGRTMSAQADILRDPTNPISPSYSPELAMMKKNGHLGQSPFSPLPPTVVNDPNFRPGVGSMIAGNQPGIKNIETNKEPEKYRPIISEETRKSLEALEKLQHETRSKQMESVEKKSEEKTTDPEKESKKILKDAEDDTKFYSELRGLLNNEREWDKLNNPERKKKIEGRLEPMDFTDIILYGEVRQNVTVKEGLVITFRTVSGAEDLAIKRMMYGERGSDRYMMDKFSIMQLTAALVSINDVELPSHLDKDKKFDETKFLEKFEVVTKYPIDFIGDIGLQYMWFHDRVRDLFAGETEALKNG